MKDIIKQINLRLASPFVFSFCVAWIFINWPIVVGLFWYNGETICNFGYASHGDLIQKNTGWVYNLLLPSLSGIAYMAVIPIFGYLNAVYLAFVRKIRNKSVHGITQNLPISYKRYNKLATDARNRMSELAKEIENEEKKFALAKKQILELEKSVKSKDEEVKLHKLNSNSRSLNGYWMCNINHKSFEGSSETPFQIKISDNSVFNEKNRKLSSIEGFFYSPYSKQVAIKFIDVEYGVFFHTDKGYYTFNVSYETGIINSLDDVDGVLHFTRVDTKM